MKHITRSPDPLVSFAALAFVLAFGSCSTPPSDAVVVETPPDRASFAPVGLFMNHRCGTIDCHGTPTRNMKLSGYEGNRLRASDVAGGIATTDAELDQSYQSVIGLEPEIMSAVVADHGASPERLTLVRKARGTEHHKGLAVVTPGDDQDTCLTSWLAGAVSTAACARALNTP